MIAALWERHECGASATVGETAADESINPSYAGCVLWFTLLEFDLVDAIPYVMRAV